MATTEQGRPKVQGRPTEQGRPKVQVKIWLDPWLADAIRKEARRYGQPISTFVGRHLARVVEPERSPFNVDAGWPVPDEPTEPEDGGDPAGQDAKPDGSTDRDRIAQAQRRLGGRR